MAYTKPVVLAQNSKQGSYAAGCPENNTGGGWDYDNCKICDRAH
jgi:hypothetical protein